MRALLIALTLCTPAPALADLLHLLPLKRIERKMIYPLSAIEVDPASLGLSGANVHSISSSAEEIVVWTLSTARASAPTVLYFQGNAGNLASRASRFAAMQDQGINVIAMSYRGSSGSSGLPSETGITSDALTTFQRAGDLLPNTQARNLILYGESLGAAVAIALLAKLAPQDRPAGVILEAPFTSTPDMARAMTDVPDNLIARISDRWESRARAHALTIPTLVIHGTDDAVTPIEMGRAIFNAAPVTDKDFIAVRGASHSGTWRTDTMPRLWRFIRAYGG